MIGSIDIAGVLGNGAQNADVLRMYDSVVAGTGFVFDDLTPLLAVPEPSVCLAFCIGGLTIWVRCPRQPPRSVVRD